MNKYAIYIDDGNSGLVNKIYAYFKQKNPYCDFTILSNNEPLFYNQNISSLSTYYLKFFDGSIIFCNINDYMEHADAMMQNCYLITTAEDMIRVGRSKQQLHNATLLSFDGDEIYEL